ncbi:MAG TPA: MFS transporter, partial [Planctomycetota bacterium]|nr:MFS transporter [Planctomycetota bacterium]
MDLLSRPRGRKLAFALLYFSEGAPIGFLWWALPTLMRERGVALEEIGALVSLLALPWALKFLWAPLVDLLRGPRWTLRGWIVASQAVMALSLAPLAWLLPRMELGMITAALLVHALAAATQDVAIDALAIRATPAAERGSLNGWMQTGMLTGRALFGGGALLARDALGERTTILLLGAAVVATMPVALACRDRSLAAGASASLAEFGGRLRRAFAQRGTWAGLAFAAIGGAGFEGVGALAGSYLVDLGHGASSAGWFFSAPAVLLMIAGSLLGGRFSDRAGRRASIAASLLATVVAVAAVALVPRIAPGSGAAVFVPLGALYLAIGLFTASSYALFMDLTDPRLGATQVSAFMGATTLCESWAARLASLAAPRFGYPAAFLGLALVSL